MRILVTGATGYVGGRLIPRLIEEGHQVTVLVRHPDRVTGREWANKVELVVGDLLGSDLPEIDDINVAYYLVHSMTESKDFAARDVEAVNRFLSIIPRECHVIYLGGIQPEGNTASKHLASRIEVGNILKLNRPTTEFRAGPIIGSGSASFEMVRNLTERLPFMIAPKWVKNRVRPIAIRDMLEYLLKAAETQPVGSFDIGAKDLRFIDMMMQWAEVRNLKRFVIPIPILAPTLAARWVGLVTPITNRLAIPLVEGMLSDIVGDPSAAEKEFPKIKPIHYRKAVKLAQSRIESNFIETRWSGALGNSKPFILEEREGIIHETRRIHSNTSGSNIFKVISSAGGNTGWFAWNWAWKIRGFIDGLIGGPGLRRGRRHPEELLQGEALDFWRVEKVIPNRLIRLRAEMKVPGKAWLEWEIEETEQNTFLKQTAFFNPNGILGRLYWVFLYPIHGRIFSDMIKSIIRRAEAY